MKEVGKMEKVITADHLTFAYPGSDITDDASIFYQKYCFICDEGGTGKSYVAGG